MPNLKQIRKRIRSVKSTQQITRVMEMVSASKLAKTQGLLARARPYTDGLEGLMRRIVASFGTEDEEGRPAPNPFMQPRAEVKQRCMVIFTSDRGLCGSYNNNVLVQAEKALVGEKDAWTLVCVGKKGRDLLRKRGWSIGHELVHTHGPIQPEDVDRLSNYVTSGFESGAFDEVLLTFMEFHSVGRYRPATRLFLPIRPEILKERADYIFEPDAKSVLDRLVPDYLTAKLNVTIYETLCSEYAARMAAMRNATDNARDMIDSLTLAMNKARQAAITKEISEIVGGAEAIKG
jgi:F-type H+-transporting ATPase subunit gamma